MKKNFLVLLLTLFMLTAISAPAAAAGQEQGFNFAGLPGISTEKVSLPATTVFSTNTTVLSTTGSGDTISKAEWIHQLVTTFDMTVEQNNYPDNYYSDLTTDHQYYKDIMIAVQFGVIDLPAGEELAPDAPANREFVAHTLNFCLGYQPEENTAYTFSEASTVTYPDDIQIAIDKGWFTLTDGAFLPESPVTSIQAAELLKTAKEINASAEVDTSHKDTITFKDNVVVVPKGTEVTVDGDETTTVRITNCPVNIAVGDTFAVYTDIVPGTYSAEKVTKTGSDLVISAKEVPFEDAVTAFDIEGSSTADLTDTVPEGDAEIYYVLKNGTQTQSKARAIEYGVDYIKISKTIQVSSGVSVKITSSLTNLHTDYKASFTEVKVITSGVATVNCSVSADVMKMLDLPSSVKLAYVPIYGIGRIEVTANLSISGYVSLNLSSNFSTGFQWTKNDGLRSVKSFSKREFTISAEAKIDAGITASIGLADFKIVQGDLFASVGARMTAAAKTRTNGPPNLCIHTQAWLYAETGFRVSFLGFGYSKTYPIWDANNSPVRMVRHYEDGNWVKNCTFGDKEFGSYFTASDSGFWGGSLHGSSTGYDSQWKPYTIYEYTLDESDHATITKYYGNVSSILIPKTLDGHDVVAIGPNAFEKNTLLRNVTIPEGITKIDEYAFRYCTGLTDVTFPDSLTSIGIYAFGNCTGLTDVTLPQKLETMSYCAFENCINLQKVFIPKSLKNDSWNCGYNGTQGPFNQCSALNTVVFEDGITNIASGLFTGCTGLRQITIPDTVTSIGEYAFSCCSNLTDVKFSNSLTKIDEHVFRYCTGLTNVTFPDSLTSIGIYAFGNCTGLTDVTLPKKLETMGYCAFENCTNLQKVFIPKSLKDDSWNYGYNGTRGSFNQCSALNTVVFEDGITNIASGLFAGCTGLSEITIPDAVTSIGEYAFRDCTKLTKVELSKDLTNLGERAFSGCSNLPNIKLPEGLAAIDDYVFRDCTSLTDVTLPDSLTSIGVYTFDGCTSLVSAQWNKTLSTIPKNTFYGCKSLKKFIVPDHVTTIEQHAFYSCTSLEELTLSSNLETIETYAFYNNDALKKLVIPDSVTSIGTYCFADCNNLKDLTFGSGLTEIPSNAFYQCPGLEKISLPYRLKTIGSNAFVNCTGLTGVTIPRSVTSIDSTAFSYSDRMTIYGVAGTTAETFAKAQGFKFEAIDIAATKVTLDKTEATLAKGQTLQLTPTITPADFTDATAWKTSDASIATVTDAGLVKGVGVGTATINFVVGNVKASCTVTVTQPITSIDLNKTSLSLDGGATYQLTATAYPSDALNPEVSWSSSAPEIASVSDTGLVTAKKKGTAEITVKAKDGSGVTNKCTVTVLGNLHIVTTPTDMQSSHPYEVNSNEKWQYTKTGAAKLAVTFNDQTSVEQGTDYIYIYSKDGTQIGKYTGTELAGKTIEVPGDTVIIKLTSDDTYCEYGFAVTKIEEAEGAVAVTGVTLDKTTVSLEEGGNTTLTATVAPANATNKAVTWKSSNTSVATVDNGKVTAVKAGTATITVTTADGNKTATCQVTVTAKAPTIISVTRVTLNKVSVSLEEGNTTTLTATVAPTNATNKAVTWSSSNTSVATVDNGKVTAIKAGTATITVTTADGGKTAACEIKVIAKAPEVNFSDVAADAWYVSYVYDLAGKGIINGITPTTFDPEGKITRGQFVKILAYASGDDLSAYGGDSVFADANAHWSKANINWAYTNKIVYGKSDTQFAPDANITRQEMAVMIKRYADYKGITLPKTNAPITFTDEAEIAAWAKDAVSAMQQANIISGFPDGTFAPQGNATRAQAAKMISVFLTL